MTICLSQPSLDHHYSEILAEYTNFVGPGSWIAWPQTDIYHGDWAVIPIWLWPEPDRHPYADHFPRTCQLVEQYFPGHRAVGFSRLRAGTEILPHCGDPQPVLRYHLGIDVPPGDCGLQVGERVYHWANGKSFIFDDHLQHSAWNRTDRDRVILIIDFEAK